MKSFASEKISYRFPLWLTVIFLTLFSVPLFVLSNQILFAKIFGLVSLIVVIIALRFWLRITRLNSNRLERVVLNKNAIFDLERKYPFLRSLSIKERTVLFHRTGLLLAEVKFISGDEFSDFNIASEVAFNIALLIFESPYINLNGLVVQLEDSQINSKDVLVLKFPSEFPQIEKSSNFSIYKGALNSSAFGMKLKEALRNQSLLS